MICRIFRRFQRSIKQELLFLKKKKQKDFYPDFSEWRRQQEKVFWFFFSKKNVLPFINAPRAQTQIGRGDLTVIGASAEIGAGARRENP
jgi:hypothetical protein